MRRNAGIDTASIRVLLWMETEPQSDQVFTANPFIHQSIYLRFILIDSLYVTISFSWLQEKVVSTL